MERARPGAAKTAALAATAAVLVTTLPALSTPATAAEPTPQTTRASQDADLRAVKGSSGYCKNSDGVTVVVDFQDLGGGTVVRCAHGSQSTGLSALKNAGFKITGTNRWGDAFICRIEGKPGADDEPCIDTPPTSAYWSYWHSSNGGSWKYSDSGVTNRTPPKGSFEGWSFSTDESQSTSPPPGVTPRRPGGSGDSGGGNSGGGSGSSGGSGSGTAAGGADGSGKSGPEDGKDKEKDGKSSKRKDKDEKEKDGKSAKPSKSEDTSPGSDGTATGTSGAQGEDGDGARTADPAKDGGIPTGTVASIGAVVLIASAAGATAWRRRRAARAEQAG